MLFITMVWPEFRLGQSQLSVNVKTTSCLEPPASDYVIRLDYIVNDRIKEASPQYPASVLSLNSEKNRVWESGQNRTATTESILALTRKGFIVIYIYSYIVCVIL